MRPVNVASAPTSGQTGRKEAAKRGKRFYRGHPEPRQRAAALCTPAVFYLESSVLGWKFRATELMQ